MTEDSALRAEYDAYYDRADNMPGRRPMTFDEWCKAHPITPQFQAAFDTPETPEQAILMLAKWGDPSNMVFNAARAKKAHALLKELFTAASALEKRLPDTPEWFAAGEAKEFRKALKGRK